MGCQCLSKEIGEVNIFSNNDDEGCEKRKEENTPQILERKTSSKPQVEEKPKNNQHRRELSEEPFVKKETAAISYKDENANAVEEEQMNSEIISQPEIINCENDFNKKNINMDYLITDFLSKKKFTSDEAKKDFLEFCQCENGNFQQLRLDIESGAFELNCHKWYTKESFLYRLIRNTLRERNYSNWFKIRYLFHVLDLALDQCKPDPVNCVYLCGVVGKNELEDLECSKGNPLLFPGFCVTTSNISFAEELLAKNNVSEDKTLLLFTIKVDEKHREKIHLIKEILNISSNDDNKNIELLNLNLFLIINEVSHNETQGRYDVTCTLSDFEACQSLFGQQLREQGESFKDLLEKNYLNEKFYLAEIYLQIGKFEESMNIVREISDDDGDVTEEKLHFQGRLEYKRGHFDNALEFYEKLLDIQVATGKENSGSYQDMGLILYAQGNYERAFECYENHMRNLLEKYGEEDPAMATCYNNIGMVYFKRGDYENALKYYNQNLDIKLKTVGEKDPSVAKCYNNIGLIYDHQGKYQEALEYYSNAVQIIRTSLGENDPTLAKSYNNIGLVYYAQHQYREALANYSRALQIHQAILGMDDPATAINYTNIGSVFFAQDKLADAFKSFQMALNIKISAYGENHPLTATGYTCIGAVYSKKQEYVKALEYYEKALKIKSECLGDNHPETKKIRKIRDDISKKKHLDVYS